MKLTVFQSGKGDCLLLEGEDGRRMLVDGGMRAAYSEHVAPALGKLRKKGELIDVVYVSHIDQDHISGVLQMMDDEVAWRIHDYQVKHGNPRHKRPDAPRPPQVKQIWHNAFHEQISKNEGEVEDMLAASAAILSGSEIGKVVALASRQAELVTSVAEAIQLARRVSPEQLGIKLNQPAKGKLMMVRDAPTAAIRLGGIRIRILGPFHDEIKQLRAEWNDWLRKNKEKLRSIQSRAEDEAGKFSVREIGDLLLPKLRQAQELESLLPLGGKATKLKLGEREKVTTPNLASLMLFVEEGGKTLLLTGDGHHEDILKGLRHIGRLNGTAGLHVDVLKVQHHGSEHNLDEEFCRTVTADHYIFCGNGEHENPDLRVLQAIADSRLGPPGTQSPNAQAGNRFRFWFNSSRAVTEKEDAKTHMGKVEALVKKLVDNSGGRLEVSFIQEGSSCRLQI